MFRTEELDHETAAVLRRLEVDDLRFDFWKEARGGLSAEIMAAPGEARNLTDILDKMGVSYDLKIEDVQRSERDIYGRNNFDSKLKESTYRDRILEVNAPGLVNFVPAGAYHSCLNTPEAFTQPGAST